jgi:hypothetical protein
VLSKTLTFRRILSKRPVLAIDARVRIAAAGVER